MTIVEIFIIDLFPPDRQLYSSLLLLQMNLASRCREAISHVAMLKKELAMQQKRTAAALASQREQTQRMADTLTNSMDLSRLSRSSSDDVDETNNKSRNVDVSRVSSTATTPSPLRDAADSSNTGSPDGSYKSSSSSASRPSSPSEEARDSPPPVVPALSPSAKVGSELDEDDTVEDTIGHSSTVSSSPTDSAEEPLQNVGQLQTKNGKEQPSSRILYSTPKRHERGWKPTFHDGANDADPAQSGGLFPHSASPRTFNSNSKSYNEEFPSDIIDQPNRRGNDTSDGETSSDNQDGNASVSSQQRRINLINSIDAFEQSFSMDFPDSFTPKGTTMTSSPDEKTKKSDIYNPFFQTPERLLEKPRSRFLEDSPSSTEEEKKINEPHEVYHRTTSFETPPRDGESKPAPYLGEPARPEKTIPSAARARYEQALQPRQKTTIQEKKTNKQLSMDEMVSSEGVEVQVDASGDSILDIMDAYEGNDEAESLQPAAVNGSSNNKSGTSISSRFHTIKSLRRNVKQPVSYAEPPLNTKLRQGDTYFPKVEGSHKQTPIVSPAVSPVETGIKY